MRDERWQIISDLHLAPGVPRPGTAVAFGLLVDGLDAELEEHLVLLGDTVEVDGFSVNGSFDVELARRQLQSVIADHPWLCREARRLLDAGHSLHVVVGNHDVGLAHPEVWRDLAAALGHRDGVRLHPWFLHVPGVLYAEHGHQHHHFHRLPGQVGLSLWGSWVLWAAPLTRVEKSGSRAPGGRRRAGAVWRARRRQVDAERRMRTPEARAMLSTVAQREHAAELAVPLHGVSALSWRSTIRAVMGVCWRLMGGRPVDYLHRPARRIARIFETAETPLPVVAFGHTHRATLGTLPGGTCDARTGTWLNEQHPVVSVRRTRSPGPAGVLGRTGRVHVALRLTEGVPGAGRHSAEVEHPHPAD